MPGRFSEEHRVYTSVRRHCHFHICSTRAINRVARKGNLCDWRREESGASTFCQRLEEDLASIQAHQNEQPLYC